MMSVFEIILLSLVLLVVAGLIFMAWLLHLGLIKPQKQAKKEEKKLAETTVEEAKAELKIQSAKTRMDTEKKTIGKKNLDKLRTLRRK
jgi:uncharacterized membrane protein